MTRTRILVTTTVDGQRYARGDEITLGDRETRDLIAIDKAEIAPEKPGKDEPADAPTKATRKE